MINFETISPEIRREYGAAHKSSRLKVLPMTNGSGCWKVSPDPSSSQEATIQLPQVRVQRLLDLSMSVF